MKFHIYKDAQGYYRWRLKTSNENIIADSTEGYPDKENCYNGILSMKQDVAAPIIVDETGE